MSKIRLWYGLHNPPNIIKYTEVYTLSGCTGWYVEYISITITMLKSNVEKQYKAKRNKNKTTNQNQALGRNIPNWLGSYPHGASRLKEQPHIC